MIVVGYSIASYTKLIVIIAKAVDEQK